MVYFRLMNLMHEYWNPERTFSTTEVIYCRMRWEIVNKTGYTRITLSYSRCCRGKAISITHSESVSVAVDYPARNAHAP